MKPFACLPALGPRMLLASDRPPPATPTPHLQAVPIAAAVPGVPALGHHSHTDGLAQRRHRSLLLLEAPVLARLQLPQPGNGAPRGRDGCAASKRLDFPQLMCEERHSSVRAARRSALPMASSRHPLVSLLLPRNHICSLDHGAAARGEEQHFGAQGGL